MDIHIAFTDICKIIDGINLKEMDNLKRKSFLVPILVKLHEDSFLAGQKEARLETIKHIREKL